MSVMSDDDKNSVVDLYRVPSQAPSTSADSADSHHDQPSTACIICQQQGTTRKCALCDNVLICSMNCQQIAVIDDVGSDHFSECVTETTADILYKDVLSNRIPTDWRTFNDFHFLWFIKITDKRKLLELYATIIRKADVTAFEMDIWVREKKLFERIAMLFHSSPKLISLEDLMWLKASDLWTYEVSETARAIFEDVIARKQEQVQ